MRPTTDIDQFIAAPVGRYLQGPSFIVWVYAADLLGNAYFGQPGHADFGAIARMYQLPAHPALTSPYDVVIDCSLLVAVDLASFQVFARYASALMPGFAVHVRRCAIVRPPGLAGTTLTGLFHEMIRPQLPAELFAAGEAAFRWLGRGDGDAAFSAVNALLDDVRGPSPTVRLLRDFLATQLPQVSLSAAARRLSTSERSLQRELHAAGTSFRAEVNRARVEAARTLLLGSNLKLDEVAHRVGCSSLPHLSGLFRRLTGITPTGFRERGRNGGGTNA